MVHDIRAQVHVHSPAVTPATTAYMYGVEGFVLPVLDPDSQASYQTIWDQLVPKDSDTDTIDLDTAGADSTPAFEPGESAMAEVLNVGLQPERVYKRAKLITFASAPKWQEEAGVLEYAPSDTFTIRVKRRIHVNQPSIIVFGLSSPDLTDTVNAEPLILEETEWPRVQYMEMTLEQALIKFMGLTEAGAETPWEEAAALLRKHLEPDLFEETAGAWGQMTWSVFVDAVIDHSVEGTMGKLTLGTGG